MPLDESAARSRLSALISPPRELLGVVRWTGLLVGLSLLGRLAWIIVSGAADLPRTLLMLAALLVLGFEWVRTYRFARLHILGTTTQALALGGLVATLGDPTDAFGLLYAAVAIHAIYGSPRRLVSLIAILVLGPFGAAGLPLHETQSTPLEFAFVSQLPGLLIVATLLHMLVRTLVQNARAAAGDRVIVSLRTALAAATDTNAVYALATEAAQELVALSQIRPVAVQAQPAQGPIEQLAEQLGVVPGNHYVLVPLVVEHEIAGALAVITPTEPDTGLRTSLEALGAEITHVLEATARVEELHRRRSEARFRSLVQNASEVIRIVDQDSTIRYQTPSVERLLGFDPTEHLGRKLADLVHPDDASRLREALALAAEQPGLSPTIQYRSLHRDGRWLLAETAVNNLLDDPNVQGLVLTSRDVTHQKQLQDQLAHQALHDPLTELPNRALFHDRVERELAHPRHPNERLAVLWIDLDNFKTVNDSLGHAAGDALLVSMVSRMRGQLGPSDTLARFGGDEFAVLLPEIADSGAAAEVAERIGVVLREPMVIAGREIVTTASIGVAMAGVELATVEDLLRAADVAMYRAKHEGRARYAVFERSMQSDALDRLELEAGLRLALERNEFVVYYQPTVGLNRGTITGFEALVRWNHPTRGVVPPAAFIPIAEETGLIVPLGEWVLRQACQQAREWQDAFSTDVPLTMSVNLSVRQFQDPTIVERVSAVLRDSQLAPGSLILEITESVMMQDSESTLAKIQALKALGLRLALDDFGTGYSSLGYLQRFPLDILKIDKSFVDRVMDGHEPMALVRTIIQLGQTLQMRVVAEGIEHVEQADQLKALGCGLGQGYLFARPLPAVDVRSLLDRSLQPRTDTAVGRKDPTLARAA